MLGSFSCTKPFMTNVNVLNPIRRVSRWKSAALDFQTTISGRDNSLCLIKRCLNSQGDCYGISLLDSTAKPIADCRFYECRNTKFYNYFAPKDYGDFLVITHLNSIAGVKGSGTKLLDETLKQSIKMGFEGRIAVGAENSPSLNSYRNNNGQVPTPVPFYFNYGFRPAHESYEADVNHGMECFYKTGKYIGPKKLAMYLPMDAISKIRERLKI